ncbi:metal-dependent hydrolase [Dermatobacter hominis]|uniref:metal-dependent hydrolase n=1 Tax=Dermatobacter hominis TaxID=2884263 RepID=UPI001D0F5BCB|nr:metal-dependent hydrolase [Dermatobacter hominis]UDY36587.1 metal-dependent hydrolase [Dermatobacter hominis]
MTTPTTHAPPTAGPDPAARPPRSRRGHRRAARRSGLPSRPSADRRIPVRRLRHDHARHEMSAWIVPDDPIFSHFLATLSAVFPNGEDFFVASVRRHRAAVADDPVLQQQVKGFIGQEAMHGREHRRLNERLASMGYRTERADRTIGVLCDLIARLPPATLPIAATAAAEHYTGLLAEAVLSDPRTRATLFGQEAIEPLIAWHALEELEHKNVAFDVMEAAGGGYAVRVAGFAVTSTVLAGSVAVEWGRAVWEDRDGITRAHRRRFHRNLRRQRLLSPWFLRNLLGYLRPGFHPDDTDTDDLVREWSERLADVAGPNRRSAEG